LNKYTCIFLAFISLSISLSFTTTSLTNTSTFITDGNWSNPLNWKKGKLPSTNSKVVIEADVVVDIPVEVREMTVNSDVKVILQETIPLKLTKHLFNDGTISGEGELIFNGHSAQFIRGQGSFYHIRINNPSTVHIKDEIQVFGNLYVDDGNLLTFDHLNLRCDFETQSTAQVGIVRGKITGNVTTEQCYPARRANRLISPSVTTNTSIRKNWQENAESFYDESISAGLGTHITGINPGSGPAYLSQDGHNGFDYNPSGNASMFQYQSQQAEFIHVKNTDVNTLTAGSPYKILIRGDRSTNLYSNSATPTPTRLRSHGKLVTGNFSENQLSKVKNGFSLIGNPYHAQVDMNTVLDNSVNLKKGVYYVWDPKLGGVQDLEEGGGRGAFVVVELPSGVNSSHSDANQYLQPMQAVFVQTENDGFTQINFSEDDKVIAPSQSEILSDSEETFLNVQLFNQISFQQGSTPSDSFKINFGDSYSDSSEDDVMKLPNADENLTRAIGQELVALERRTSPEESLNLPIYIDQYRRENYVLNFETSVDFTSQVYLVDHYLNTETLVDRSNSTYEFTVNSSISESSAKDRFSLKLLPVTLSTTTDLLSEVKLSPNPTRDSFQISGLSNLTKADIRIYNMMGQEVYSRTETQSPVIRINDFQANAGVYMVNLNSGQLSKTFKLVIKN
jgi:hypothetical protein